MHQFNHYNNESYKLLTALLALCLEHKMTRMIKLNTTKVANSEMDFC